MCPDNDTPAPTEQNPTLAEDDKFRRTIDPSEGPNKNGYDDLVKAAHTRPDADEPSPIATPHAESIDETSAQTTATQPIVDHVEPPAQQED
jgi:hypothetical protein